MTLSAFLTRRVLIRILSLHQVTRKDWSNRRMMILSLLLTSPPVARLCLILSLRSPYLFTEHRTHCHRRLLQTRSAPLSAYNRRRWEIGLPSDRERKMLLRQATMTLRLQTTRIRSLTVVMAATRSQIRRSVRRCRLRPRLRHRRRQAQTITPSLLLMRHGVHSTEFLGLASIRSRSTTMHSCSIDLPARCVPRSLTDSMRRQLHRM